MLTALFMIFGFALAVIWSFVFLPISFFGVRLYKIEGYTMKKFIKKVNHSSIWNNEEPEGWICGRWYFGCIHSIYVERCETKYLWILCTKKFFESNIQQRIIDSNGKTNKITYWVREGSFWSLTYNSRQLDLPKKEIREVQASAVSEIIKVFNEKSFAVCLLYGNAGSGKSMTVYYLCTELLKTKINVNLCDTHAPYDHADNFDSFYNKINPTDNNPLIVVLEEVDGLVFNLHNGKIEQRQDNPIQLKNKTDWNSFLDKFDRGIYPHTILVMTTNKPISWFNDLDPSYLREGRVDLKIQF